MKNAIAALALLLILCGLKPAASFAAGEQAAAEGSATASVEQMTQRLQQLRPDVSESDKAYQQLVLNDVPNLLESLELQKRFGDARKLALVKLDIGKRLHGEQSITALDALQDLMFIGVQERNDKERKQYLANYVAIVDALRKAGKEDLIDTANQIRTQRLQRKLESAAQTLNQQM